MEAPGQALDTLRCVKGSKTSFASMPGVPYMARETHQADGFLFMEPSMSWNGDKKQATRHARAFVMQKARRSRYWSTVSKKTKEASSRKSSSNAEGTARVRSKRNHTKISLAIDIHLPIVEKSSKHHQRHARRSEQTCCSYGYFHSQTDFAPCLNCSSAALAPKILMSDGKIDPFAALPEEMDYESSFVFHLCKSGALVRYLGDRLILLSQYRYNEHLYSNRRSSISEPVQRRSNTLL